METTAFSDELAHRPSRCAARASTSHTEPPMMEASSLSQHAPLPHIAADGGTTPSASNASQPSGSTSWSGHVLRGDSTEALRNYLRSVQEVKASRFEVQWNPATVQIDREAAIRSLVSVSRDGATFVFL